MATITDAHDKAHNAMNTNDKTTADCHHGNRTIVTVADSLSDAGIEEDFGSHSDVEKDIPSEKASKNVEFAIPSLEAYLTCPFCDKVFHNPHRLPCGHTMCLGCIAMIAESKCSVRSCDHSPNSNKPVHNTIADYLTTSSESSFQSCQHRDNRSDGNDSQSSCEKCQNRHDYDVITNLKTAVREIRRRLTNLTEEKRIWERHFATLNHQYDLSKDKVAEIFDDLNLHLQNRRKERLARLDEIATTRLIELSGNIERVNSLSMKTDFLLEDIKRLSQLGKINRLLLLRMRLRCLSILTEMESMESLTVDTISIIDVKDSRASLMHFMDTCLTNNIRVVFK